MDSVEDLEAQLLAVLKLDEAQRVAVANMAALSAQHGRDPSLMDQIKRKHGQKTSDEIFSENESTIQVILQELADHNSPAAVKSIQRTFTSEALGHRLGALGALSKMSVPEAQKAIAKRTSWLSSASKEEKNVAQEILEQKKATQ